MVVSNQFKVVNKDGLAYLQIPSFEETHLVHHGFSTRLGGVSEGIYESMNLGFRRGDSDENVRKNFELLCEAIGIKASEMVFTDQVHEDKIEVVSLKDIGKGFDKDSDLKGIDGFITNEKNVALVTFYADCVPLYFLDPVKEVIGLTHAGWRGTVKHIGPKTLKKMNEIYGVNPEDVLVGIGPSIGPCCFEVSGDVKIEVEKILNHDIIEKIVGKSRNADKYMIDLWTLNAELLLEAGVKKENITKTDICTMCNKEVFFSHRGSNGQRGSLVAIMALK